jgi:hypothetical protein
VALIHATPAAIPPAVAAFGDVFPEARLWHLMDDRLAGDADEAGGMVPALRRRMLSLLEHAIEGGADGVLLTCSMYGTTEIAGQLWERPVVASDQAMHDRLAAERPARVAVLGSMESAVADAERRLRLSLRRDSPETKIVGVMCPGAARAALAGDREALRESLLAAARPLAGEVDAFALGQYSVTGPRAELESALGAPVLSPPHLAAQELRERLRAGLREAV